MPHTKSQESTATVKKAAAVDRSDTSDTFSGVGRVNIVFHLSP